MTRMYRLTAYRQGGCTTTFYKEFENNSKALAHARAKLQNFKHYTAIEVQKEITYYKTIGVVRDE